MARQVLRRQSRRRFVLPFRAVRRERPDDGVRALIPAGEFRSGTRSFADHLATIR
ncbi:MAG TPA: hypothetical protein VGP36_01005 [Mycobacteriales bacterium]|jgi:hypothetical protein|nr:hypothetical protein [Mycobacteriales bacterium]